MSRKAFSLLELLVVIGIIALLLAIAVPALSTARAYGYDATCRNHLRQLFQAQQTYAIDHGQFTALWSEAEPRSWRVRLEQHLPESSSTLNCPLYTKHETESEHYGDVEVPKASYGLNGVMQFDRWRFQPQRVPRPGSIIAIAEQAPSSLEGAMTSDGYGVWASETDANWFRSPEHDPHLGYRHPGGEAGANVAMMDGSVTRLSHEQLSRDSGHWYWFDALANDTAASSDQEATPMTGGPVPMPPVGGVGGGGGTAPCGCPIDP